MPQRPSLSPRLAVFGVAAVLWSAAPAHAERLPLTAYSTAQGLSGNEVSAAVEDSQGFLWIGTEHGLSRFDGRQFRTFGKDRGLADERVTSLAISPDDLLWVGTATDVYRLDLRRGETFSAIPAEGRRTRWEHTALVLDRDGRLWCGADGLYRLERAADGRQMLRRVPLPPEPSAPGVNAIAVDGDGTVWVAGYDWIARGRADGAFRRIESTGPNPISITFLAPDSAGRVWVTGGDALSVIDRCTTDGAADTCSIRRVLGPDVVPWAGPVWAHDGRCWIGTARELLELDAEARVLRRISREQGLAGRNPAAILLDRRGDLWIGVEHTALQRLVADGLTAFGEADGLVAGLVTSILRTRNGELVAIGHPHVVQRLEGERFTSARPLMPSAVKDPGWGWYQAELQDRFGEWWMSTANGIVRWPAVRHPDDLARTRAIELLAWRGCFSGQGGFRVYEDSRSDIWIGTFDINHTVHRWSRATGAIECFSSTKFLGSETAPTAFLDDGRGTLWIGFYNGQVARFRHGRFACLIDCENPSQGNITGMTIDRAGRLWVATNRAGVLRLDRPDAEQPAAVRLTTAEGLTSNRARAVVEDRFGRVYIGSDLGIDVIDGRSGRIGHYGVEEGLPHPFVNTAKADDNGDLWFGTVNGLAWLRPAAPAAAAPARVLVDGVRVAGVPRDVPAAGLQEISGLVLAADQRNLEVDFVALPRAAARTLRFQYRLSDEEPWSPVSSGRSVVLAGLSAGAHRLQIRSLDAGGQASPQIVAVSFRVLVPFYRRGWFLALATLVTLGVITLAYRWRVAYVAALERQRTRIAMDLHDEMGSRLGSIGLLADLAADEAGAGTPQRTRLEHIAETAAEMGSSLADIVWSLRRGVMTLEAVAQHLTEHGRRLFPGPHPTFEANGPDRWLGTELSPAVGRNVLMIGLEALHNCARHANAASVSVDFRPNGRHWIVTVSDDGRGFPEYAPPGSGFGLHTMRRRADEIGALLGVHSQPGHGTTVQLTFDPRAGDRLFHQMNIRGIVRRRRDKC